MRTGIANIYGVDSKEVSEDCYGLNHLSFFTSIKVQRIEVLSELLDNDVFYQKNGHIIFERDLAKHLHSVLNEYLYLLSSRSSRSY